MFRLTTEIHLTLIFLLIHSWVSTCTTKTHSSAHVTTGRIQLRIYPYILVLEIIVLHGDTPEQSVTPFLPIDIHDIAIIFLFDFILTFEYGYFDPIHFFCKSGRIRTQNSSIMSPGNLPIQPSHFFETFSKIWGLLPPHIPRIYHTARRRRRKATIHWS